MCNFPSHSCWSNPQESKPSSGTEGTIIPAGGASGGSIDSTSSSAINSGCKKRMRMTLLDFGLAEELNPAVRFRFISFLHTISAGWWHVHACVSCDGCRTGFGTPEQLLHRAPRPHFICPLVSGTGRHLSDQQNSLARCQLVLRVSADSNALRSVAEPNCSAARCLPQNPPICQVSGVPALVSSAMMGDGGVQVTGGGQQGTCWRWVTTTSALTRKGSRRT